MFLTHKGLHRSPDSGDTSGGTPSPTSGDTSGETPSSTTGVSEESSPAPSSSQPASTSETTKKLDVGMGPRKEHVSAADTSQPSETQYDDTWWQQHGEAIFKNDRFKELNGYKKQYQEAEPVLSFIEQQGGLEELNAFYQHLGPVWNHLSSSENANELWSQLLPVLNNFLTGNELFPQTSPASGNSGEEDFEGEYDDTDPMVKSLQEKIGELENQLGEHNKKFETQAQKEKREQMMRVKAHRDGNLSKYDGLLDQKLKEANLPSSVREYVSNLIVNNIIPHMPKARNGQPIHPLDQFSEEAFGATWEKAVLPEVNKMRKQFIDSAKTTIDNGGPTLPDMSKNGVTPSSNQPRQFETTQQKARRFAEGIRKLNT